MARASECLKQSNVAAGTYKFTVRGGLYAFDFVGTGTGTVNLNRLGPDGATYLSVSAQLTATGVQSPLYLPGGQYEVVIATFTANYFALTSFDIG